MTTELGLSELFLLKTAVAGSCSLAKKHDPKFINLVEKMCKGNGNTQCTQYNT